MKLAHGFPFLSIALCGAFSLAAAAQSIPDSIGFEVEGFFSRSIKGNNPANVLVTDNDLTNGYHRSFDTSKAPAHFRSKGPEGTAAVQWKTSDHAGGYVHAGSLWFHPLDVPSVALEEYFSLGFLFFNHDALIARNGTPLVDIALRLNVTNPADIDPITSTFHLALNNTAGSDNPEEMIEPVTILNPLEPLDFHDSQGKPCFFELTIRVIPETDDDAGEGSSYDFSQSQEGVAVLFGRLTTRPEDPGAANRKSADDAGTPNRNSTDPRRQRATSILR